MAGRPSPMRTASQVWAVRGFHTANWCNFWHFQCVFVFLFSVALNYTTERSSCHFTRNVWCMTTRLAVRKNELRGIAINVLPFHKCGTAPAQHLVGVWESWNCLGAPVADPITELEKFAFSMSGTDIWNIPLRLPLGVFRTQNRHTKPSPLRSN